MHRHVPTGKGKQSSNTLPKGFWFTKGQAPSLLRSWLTVINSKIAVINSKIAVFVCKKLNIKIPG